ncbi:MAG: UvrD-helicase domain-containing protein, partial [Acidimicrobiia bacterium]
MQTEWFSTEWLADDVPVDSPLFADLNPVQREAVAATDGPVLVVAGAGSGKTRVLTYRIAHLIRDLRVPSQSILAITFTNKAADEMKERVGHLIGGAVKSMWVSTFHSACVRILRREAARFGYRSGFSIYDQADSLRLVTQCVKDLDLDTKRFPPKNIQAAISNAKNELVDYETFARSEEGFYHEQVADVYRLYQQRLLEASAMDFDDLLMVTVELFGALPDVLEQYQQRFRYIHVDEYQDTNRAQYTLVRQLAEGHRNLCVVGDSDQSIYRWRGADVRNILDFEKDYPDARVIVLEQNYRSTATILDAANAVIANNP